jgi:hypothetical protein
MASTQSKLSAGGVGAVLGVFLLWLTYSPMPPEVARRIFVPPPAADHGDPAHQDQGLPKLDIPDLITRLGLGNLPKPSLPSIPGVHPGALFGHDPILRGGKKILIDIYSVEKVDGSLVVKGDVTNATSETLTLPTSAISFKDSAGVDYTIGDGQKVTLQPTQYSELNMRVPYIEGRDVSLIATFDQEPEYTLKLVPIPGTKVP